jgi:MerR family transcriptional regulator, light-induced transcriptional regulator
MTDRPRRTPHLARASGGALLTTRDLALAMGVSESSIKRWADEGEIRAARTVGGHRRIPLPEALRFVRERGLALPHAEVLGLADVATLRATPLPADDATAFRELLLAGDEVRSRGLLQSLFLSGVSVAAILDGPVRLAMAAIGELWHGDPRGILLEHRATDLCAQALHQLRAFLPDPAPDAPVAAGGALEEDPYLLGTLAAATALVAEGYRAVNLGPATPAATLEDAARGLGASLLWVSIGSAPEPDRVPAVLAGLAGAVAPLGTQVIAGGPALDPDALPQLPNLHGGRSMADLCAFARNLVEPAGAAGASESTSRAR